MNGNFNKIAMYFNELPVYRKGTGFYMFYAFNGTGSMYQWFMGPTVKNFPAIGYVAFAPDLRVFPEGTWRQTNPVLKWTLCSVGPCSSSTSSSSTGIRSSSSSSTSSSTSSSSSSSSSSGGPVIYTIADVQISII